MNRLACVEHSDNEAGLCDSKDRISLRPPTDVPSLRISEADAASLSSSPSSFKVRLRNTFLEFKEETELPLLDIESPRADSILGDSAAPSPLRRSQSDVTGVDVYIRQRLGSNVGIPSDSIEIDGDACFSPMGRLSPMSRLGTNEYAPRDPSVSILSFSPPTFQRSPFTDNRTTEADFVMVMEEAPPKMYPAPYKTSSREATSRQTTQPSTPCLGEEAEDVRDTVMLRNIPNKYTQRMLLDQINSLGFEGTYSFFYLPRDVRTTANTGYSFVCFNDNGSAKLFMDKFSGYKLPGFNSQKVCEVSWARIQGLKANIQHYRNSPVNNFTAPEFRPLLFAAGTEIPFPTPNVGRAPH
jgi:hypothetical protein